MLDGFETTLSPDDGGDEYDGVGGDEDENGGDDDDEDDNDDDDDDDDVMCSEGLETGKTKRENTPEQWHHIYVEKRTIMLTLMTYVFVVSMMIWLRILRPFLLLFKTI